MNQLSYYVTKRLIVGSKDSSGTIIESATSETKPTVIITCLCYIKYLFDFDLRLYP